MNLEPVGDALLAGLLVGLAWHLLRTPDLFQAGIELIVLGLLMAVAWLRLEAPDVALAEAAIGAGVTGALFLNTLAGIGTHPADPDPEAASGRGYPLWLAALLALALAALMVTLVAGRLLGPAPAAPAIAAGKLTNPVTAILLDVRGYDTLLETAVLVEALMGVWLLVRAPVGEEVDVPPLLQGLVRILAPVMVVVAGAILWNGAAGTGGAFQGAAILAAAGILLRLGGFRVPFLERERARAAVAAAGTLVFLGAGLGLMAAGRAFLDYPAPWQGVLVLGIETVAMVSIAAVLVLLFEVTSPPPPESGS